MSISGLLPSRAIVASGSSALICAPTKGLKPLPVAVRISSSRLAGQCLRITACAAPCESFKVSTPSIESVGFGRFAFESSAMPAVEKGLVFQEARSLEVIRAAAYLRALSFHAHPEGRSEESLKLHRKMKTEDEFRSLRSKVIGLAQGYKRIACIVALCPLSSLLDSSIINLHPALKVTLANGEEHVLVGSLDLSQGIALPGEIVGNKPEVRSTFLTGSPSLTISAPPPRRIQSPVVDRRGRGYLSNICVAPSMRQRGIGKALLQQAQNAAQLWGVTSLYIHVVPTNEAAVKLYNKGGFTLEKEETATIASRQLQFQTVRPCRQLLHKFI